MSNLIRLDEDARLHFGGYLVYQLVDFRERFYSTYNISVGDIVDHLSKVLDELSRATNSADHLAKLHEAESALEEMDTLLTRMTPNRKREHLMPLFENQDVFIDPGDTSLKHFLSLLCDDTTLPWSQTRVYVHNMRAFFTGHVGFLLRLEQIISSEAGALTSEDRDKLSHLSKSWQRHYGRDAAPNRFEEAYRHIFRSYCDTPFHKKAAELVTIIIHRQIVSGRSTEKSALLTELLNSLDSPISAPQVGSLIDILRDTESWETAEELLLDDDLVHDLKRRVDEIAGTKIEQRP